MSPSKLRRAKAKNLVEPIQMSNFQCFDHNIDDFGHLSARREWLPRYPSEVQLSNHEGPGAEQSRSRQSSASTIINIKEEEMADSGPSDQSGKSPETKKSAVSKLFHKLGFLKKPHDELDYPYTPSPEKHGSLKEESATTTHVTISYEPAARSNSLSNFYDAIHQTSSAASHDEPPDQRLRAKQHRLLRRLHSTLYEATAIVEEFLILYKRED